MTNIDNDDVPAPGFTDTQIDSALRGAEKSRIPIQELPDVLARLRAGELAAMRQMVNGHLHLVWKRIKQHRFLRGVPREDLLSQMMEDLIAVIERLGAPDNTTAPEAVEKQIDNELKFSAVHHIEEFELNVPGHRVYRYRDLDRQDLAPEAWLDLLDDPFVPLLRTLPNGTPYRVPSRFQQRLPGDRMMRAEKRMAKARLDKIEIRQRENEYDRLRPFVITDFELKCLECFREQTAEAAAPLLGTPYRRIIEALDRLRERADRTLSRAA